MNKYYHYIEHDELTNVTFSIYNLVGLEESLQLVVSHDGSVTLIAIKTNLLKTLSIHQVEVTSDVFFDEYNKYQKRILNIINNPKV